MSEFGGMDERLQDFLTESSELLSDVDNKLVELERRGYQSDYVRTSEGLEVDFLAQAAGQPPHLIQVCLDASDPEALKREVRALSTAAGENPGCSAWLVTLDPTPPKPALPAPLQWRSAADWLLEPVEV